MKFSPTRIVIHLRNPHFDTTQKQPGPLAHLHLYFTLICNYHKLDRFKMPSSYTPQQKAQISQFVGFTSTKDSVAAKHLKSHGWNVEQAIDAYVYHFLLALCCILLRLVTRGTSSTVPSWNLGRSLQYLVPFLCRGPGFLPRRRKC